MTGQSKAITAGDAIKAVTVGDAARYRLPAMKTRVGQALDVLEAAQARGAVGVSFSGGKDSTVLLALARTLDAAIPAGWFDSGCEYPETEAFVAASGAERFVPQMQLLPMLRAGGYWGYEGAEADPDLKFDFRAFLVNEPSRQFVVKHSLETVAIGLRAGESAGRRMLRKARGRLHAVQGQSCWQAYPLMDWTEDDVWAFIAGRGLPYNPVYDRMAQVGIPRVEWRVSTLIGEAGVTLGRFARLRFLYPALYRQLVAEFPKIGNYT